MQDVLKVPTGFVNNLIGQTSRDEQGQPISVDFSKSGIESFARMAENTSKQLEELNQNPDSLDAQQFRLELHGFIAEKFPDRVSDVANDHAAQLNTQLQAAALIMQDQAQYRS